MSPERPAHSALSRGPSKAGPTGTAPVGLGGFPSPEEGAEAPRQPRLVFPPCYRPSPGGTGWAVPPTPSWYQAACRFSGWGTGAGAWNGFPISPLALRSLCLRAGRCTPLHPTFHPGPSLRRRCFPLPVFFPALAPPRAAWSGGGGGAPQEAGVFILYHHLSLPTLRVSKKVSTVM